MKTPVYRKLRENEAWFRERCEGCADVKLRPMTLGEGKVDCLAVHLEVTVGNLMLEESMLGRMMKQLRKMPEEKVKECLERDELGISDAAPLTTLEDGLRAMLAGNLILLVDGYEKILKIGSKGYPARSVANAESEKVLRGSNEGFSESVKVNTALVRKRIRSTGMKVEEMFIGERSDTVICILYMEELVYPQVLEQLRQRLKKFEIDGVLDSGVLEQLAEEEWLSPFPQFQTTQRPDLAAMEILNGRVVVICDNSPVALMLPTTLNNFMSVSEDRYNRFEIASFQRLVRYGAMMLALMLSGIYLAVIGFHTRILPTNLLLSFAEARRGVPFPSLIEILFMELAFELIREAGLRMPRTLSGTIGIVGGLIIGDAAVSANLVSPMAVVVVALSALSSFAIPNEEFAAAFRVVKYGFILLGGTLGMFGIVIGWYLFLGHLSRLTSFQIPYLIPFTAKGVPGYQDERDSLVRAPLRMMTRRPIFARKNSEDSSQKKGGPVMFADNQRISGLQVERQMQLVFLGPIMMWGVTGLNGREGLWSILLGSGILCLWIFFLLRQSHVYRYPEKYWGKFMSRIVLVGFQAYLILTGGWLVAETGEILTSYLVQGISFYWAAGILILAALGGCRHVQARGRFAQTAWPVVGSLTAMMIFFAVFQGTPEFLISQNGMEWDRENLKKIVLGTGCFLSLFLGVGFLPFLNVWTDETESYAGSLFRTVGKMALWMSAVLLVFLSVFGERGREALKYPILDLMAGVRLPGGFLRRIDLIFLSVMLFALLFTLGSIFFYSGFVCERMKLPGGRIPAAVLSFLVGTMDFGRWSFVSEYPRIVLWIFLPFFLGLTVCTAFLRRKAYGK